METTNLYNIIRQLGMFLAHLQELEARLTTIEARLTTIEAQRE